MPGGRRRIVCGDGIAVARRGDRRRLLRRGASRGESRAAATAAAEAAAATAARERTATEEGAAHREKILREALETRRGARNVWLTRTDS